MNKTMKYKLKLNYTEDELRELKELRRYYDSPMDAIRHIVLVTINDDLFRNLRKKYIAMEYEDEFDFMADINNVIMGTAVFPENKYVVHDKATDHYIYYNELLDNLRWSQLRIPDKKTKEEWLEINPAYEPMLERVEE